MTLISEITFGHTAHLSILSPCVRKRKEVRDDVTTSGVQGRVNHVVGGSLGCGSASE